MGRKTTWAYVTFTIQDPPPVAGIQWAGIDLKLEEGPRKNKPFKVVTIETLKIPLPSFLTHHKGNVLVLSPDSTPGAIPQLKLVGSQVVPPQNHPNVSTA